MENKRVLISGAGIAGPTLAYWLLRYGFRPTLVEVAPTLRTGGYVIDFWGLGYQVAAKMGLEREILEAGYRVRQLRVVNRDRETEVTLNTDFLRPWTGEGLTSLPRGELAAVIYRSISGQVETRFGDSINAIQETAKGVRVKFDCGQEQDFDLIVGADGLHSNVRRLAFGPEKKFENHLGYFVAAFEAPGYRPRDELTYIMYTRPGRQIARFSLRKDRTLVLFIFRADAVPDQPPNDLEGRKSFLNRIYGNAGWECSNILGALDLVDDLYFDTVSQIQIEPWSKGRVILIGDAAACVSLLAGEGTGLAMTEAYLLAGELARAGEDYPLAFRNYELKLRNFVDRKQKSALNFASFFAPRISRSLWLRDQAIRLLRIRPLAYLLAGRSLKDDFILPEYESDR